MNDASRREDRHPLMIPALLWGCFTGGVLLSLAGGFATLPGGLLALAPLLVVVARLRKRIT
jgi:hypothetical protein